MMMYRSFVALGDSLTVGYGDRVVGVEMGSWVDELVRKFHVPYSLNLAVSGARSDEVITQQFDKARILNPDGVSLICGGNDIAQKRYLPLLYRRRMEKMIATFVHQRTSVITSNFPDFTRHTDLAPALKWIVRQQLYSCNRIIDELAMKYHTIHYDFFHEEWLENEKYWSEDGVHPNALGYKKMAQGIIRTVMQQEGRSSKRIVFGINR